MGPSDRRNHQRARYWPVRGRPSPQRSGIRQKVLRALQLTPLPANVELGRAQMTARELGSLNVGDVIKLDHPTGDPLRLNIGDRMIGSAYVGALSAGGPDI